METMSQHILETDSKVGTSSSRSFCKSADPSVKKLFLVESRPVQQSNRCSLTGLVEVSTSLCFPSILTDSQNLEKGTRGKSARVDPCNSNMAGPDLVYRTLGNVSSQPSFVTSTKSSLVESGGRNAPTCSKPLTKTSGVDGFRDRLEKKGISTRASNLIVACRRKSSNSTYSSAWNKWSSCCDQQKANSFRCAIKFVLDFLAGMFEEGYQYNTICNFRSAISAFHEGWDGVPVG